MHKQKGLTLIELLVIIAIIGVLSTLAVVGLTGSKNKAYDVSIRQEIGQVIRIATMINNDTSFFTKLCDAGTNQINIISSGYDSQLKALGDNINRFNAGNANDCYSDADNYCVQSKLKRGTDKYWCVDSDGYAGSPTTDTTCATNTACK